MEQHYQLSDQDFIRAFQECTIDPSWFTHEAHLRLAYLYVVTWGAKQAAIRICEGISRFDRVFGSGEKFHRTITMASVGIINHFIRKSGATDFQSLIVQYPVLVNDFRRLLFTHYSKELINTPESRHKYQMPDLVPDEVFEEVR